MVEKSHENLLFNFVIGCEDLPKWKNNCPKWATDEYCTSKFMQHYCRGTCKVCGETGKLYNYMSQNIYHFKST